MYLSFVRILLPVEEIHLAPRLVGTSSLFSIVAMALGAGALEGGREDSLYHLGLLSVYQHLFAVPVVAVGRVADLECPFLEKFLIDHLLFSEVDRDSSAAMLERIETIGSLSIAPVFKVSFSTDIGMFKSRSLRINSRQSTVFRGSG